MGDLVRRVDQRGTDQALEQPRGGGEPEVAADDALVVDEGVDDLRRLRPHGRALQQHLLEADGEDIAEPHDQQQHDDGPHGGQRDVPEAPPRAGAVDRGRLVLLLVDLGERGEEDDRPPAGVLPDHLRHHQRLERVGVPDDVDAVQPGVAERAVQQAGVAQQLLEERDDDHPGQEVREIRDALHEAPDAVPRQAVQEHGERERDGKVERQLEQRYPQGVDNGRPEVGVLEHPLEVLQPDPLAGPQPVERHVVLERDDVAGHRAVVEQQEVRQSRQHQQQQDPVLAKPLPPRVPAGRPTRLGRPPLPFLLLEGRCDRMTAVGGALIGYRHRVLPDGQGGRKLNRLLREVKTLNQCRS